MKRKVLTLCGGVAWLLLSGVAAYAQITNVYVSLSGTSVYPYTNWQTAANVIQLAVDAAPPNSTVFVTNGVYSLGGKVPSGRMISNRVCIDKSLTLKSVNGPAKTIIQGSSALTVPVRGVYLGNGTLDGFTVTNGGTFESSSLDEGGGGGIYASISSIITNCIITGNRATVGGGVMNGQYRNCVITNNYAEVGGGAAGQFGSASSLYGCTLVNNSAAELGGGSIGITCTNCVFSGNTAVIGGGAYQSFLQSCTLMNNRAFRYGGGTVGSNAVNCIIYDNLAMVEGTENYTNVPYMQASCTTPLPSAGALNFTNSPLVIEPGNPRLLPDSPCINAGYNYSWMATATDIEGNARVINTNVDLGAYEYAGASSLTGAVRVAISEGGYYVVAGCALPLTATVSGKAQSLVWSFGDGAGATNVWHTAHVWSSPGTYSVTCQAANLSGSASASRSVVVVAAAASNYYVKPGGSDVAKGTNWTTAKLTIQSAVDGAPVGGTVWVTNGTYNGGSQAALGQVVSNRVAVLFPMTVRSVNGPAVTFIEGANAGVGLTTRGVFLTDGAVLSGFTVHKGTAATHWMAKNGVRWGIAGGLLGGGILCETPQAIVTNCFLGGTTSSNVATMGGGGYGGTYQNCRILNGKTVDGGLNAANVAMTVGGGGLAVANASGCTISGSFSINNGGGLFDSTADGCTIVSNTAAYNNGGGAYLGAYSNCVFSLNTAASYGGGAGLARLDHCTLTNNSVTGSGSSLFGGGGAYKSTVLSSLVAQNSAGASGGGLYEGNATNSIIRDNVAVNGGGLYHLTPGSSYQSCVIANNYANNGGGANGVGGTYYQCTFTNNRAEYQGGGAYNLQLYTCLVANNSARYGGGVYNGQLYRSTVVGNHAILQGGGVYQPAVAQNSIFYYNTAPFDKNWAGANGASSFNCIDAPLLDPAYNSITNPPGIISLNNPRLGPGSACYNAGTNQTWMTGRMDLDGNSLIAAAISDIGAFEYQGESAQTGTLTAAISATDDSAVAEAAIAFSAQTTGMVGSLVWKFGDGATVTNVPLARHAWSTPGTYTVSLIVSNVAGTVTATTNVMILSSTAAWYVATTGNDGSAGTSWATAKKTLQAAVDAAPIGATVWVTNGSYSTGGRPAGDQNVTNVVAVERSLTLRSLNGPGVTKIVGSSGPVPLTNQFGVRGLYLGEGASLIGFTVTNGQAGGSPNPRFTTYGGGDLGGGIFCESDSSVVSNCVVAGNAGMNGGGVSGGTLYSSVLLGNTAWASSVANTNNMGNGGGAYYSRAYGCLVSSNTAYLQGAGLAYGFGVNSTNEWNTNSTLLTTVVSGGGGFMTAFTNCVIRFNRSTVGGGIAQGVAQDCSIVSNTVTKNGGGAVQAVINGGVVSGNYAALYGGGTFASYNYNCLIQSNTAAEGGGCYGTPLGNVSSNCVIADNRAISGNGGGSYYSTTHNSRVVNNYASGSGGGQFNFDMRNCLIISNSAAQFGGGYAKVNNGGYGVNNCIIAYNLASTNGGGIYFSSPLMITNSIIVSNSVGISANSANLCMVAAGPATSYKTNVFYSCSTGVSDCVGSTSADPMFVDAAAGDFRLAPDSPCIDTGVNIASMTNGVDLAGAPRMQGVAMDMGVYETFRPTSGSIVCTLTPAAVLSLGAQWCIDGGVWNDSGALVESVSAGIHTVSFSPVTGYTSPANQPVTVSVSATNVLAGLYVLASNQTQSPLVFNPTTPQVYGTTNTLAASGGSGSGALSFSVLSGPGVIVGSKLTATSGTGTITLRATKAGDATYDALSTTNTVVAEKTSQSISFPSIPDQLVTATLPLVASASSGMGVSFAVRSGPATLSEGQLTFSSAGNVLVAATQAGDLNYVAATPLTNSFTVTNLPTTILSLGASELAFSTAADITNVAAQALTLTNAGLSALTFTNSIDYGEGASNWFSLSRQFGGLAISASMVVTGRVIIAGLNPGVYVATNTVTSAEATNTPLTWLARLTITKATQAALVFSPASPQIYPTTNQLTVTGGSGTGAVSFVVLSGPGQIVAGNKLVITAGAGAVPVRATKAEDSYYNAVDAVSTIQAATATPIVTNWPTATPITWIQTLADSTLSNGVASVDGAFAFTTPDATPPVGTNVVAVTFTPTDTTNYSSVAGVASVAVYAPPGFTSNPTNQSGFSGTNFTFSATATNAWTYQWYFVFNGETNLIAGATNTAYTTNTSCTVAGTYANQGGYFCVASNFVGTVASSMATLGLASAWVPYTYASGWQIYTVPAGVTNLAVDVTGAGGGSGGNGTYSGTTSAGGSMGSRVHIWGVVGVTNGAVVRFALSTLGGAGSTEAGNRPGGLGGSSSAAAGGNGGSSGVGPGSIYDASGGGGGGASAFYFPSPLSQPVLVAGGSGGGGGGYYPTVGGNGGSAATAVLRSSSGSYSTNLYTGGAGINGSTSSGGGGAGGGANATASGGSGNTGSSGLGGHAGNSYLPDNLVCSSNTWSYEAASQSASAAWCAFRPAVLPVISMPGARVVVTSGQSAALTAGFYTDDTVTNVSWYKNGALYSTNSGWTSLSNYTYASTVSMGTNNSLGDIWTVQVRAQFTLSRGGIMEVTAVSTPTTIDMFSPPYMTSQPASRTVLGYGNTNYTTVFSSLSSYTNVAMVNPYVPITLSATAAGRTPLSYQWYQDGLLLTGETSTNLTLLGSPTNSGNSYYVVVTNSDGAVTSAAALVTVDQPPVAIAYAFDRAAAGWSSNAWHLTSNSVWATDSGNSYSIMPNRMRLTSSAQNQKGSAWCASTTVNPVQSWTFSWSMQLGYYSTSPADGIGFYMQTDGTNNVVGQGGGMTNKYLGVFFDTYQNVGDPSAQTLKVFYGTGASQTNLTIKDEAIAFGGSTYAFGGSQSCPSTSAGGVPFNASATYLASSNLLTITLANDSLASGTTGSTNNPLVFAYDLDLASVFGTTNGVRIGFGGSTGSAAEKQDVLTFGGRFYGAEPFIAEEPASQTVIAGGDAAFSVTASGAFPLAYQWFFNGNAISGATATNYNVIGVTTGTTGSYTVGVSNRFGTLTSAAAILSLPVPPSITTPPLSSTNSLAEVVSFSAVASGAVPLDYQWCFNSTPIAGATSNSYSLTVSADSGGEYFLVVTNSGGSVTSSVATLRLRPAITVQPVSTTNLIGANASFVATVAGTEPLDYQWRFNGEAITGATTNKYSLTVSAGSAGAYALAVTSPYGAITSSVATLTLPEVIIPTVTWPVASGLAYGQALGESTLSDGGASVDGSFGFATPLITPNAGNYSSSVIFTPLEPNQYGSVTGAVSVAVAKATPTVSAWPTASSITYGNSLSLSSLTGGSASVGGTFAFTGASTVPTAGTCSVVVDFTPTVTANYTTVSSSVNVSVAKAPQVITLQPLATNSIPLNQFTNPIPVVASASSDLAVTLTLASDSAAVLTETNTLANIGATGTVTLRANQAGNSNYLAAAEVTASLDVTKINQTITHFAAIADQAATNPPVTLDATANSSLTVSFTVLDGPATVSGNLLTLTGAGTVVVQASQAGDATYNAAMATNQTLQVRAIASALTWGTLPVVTYADAPFTLNALSSSGLAVTYSSSDTHVVTISGNTVTIIGAGTCSIIALDAGNAFYAASTASRTLTVNRATPTLIPPAASAIAYGQHLSDSSVIGGSASLHGTHVPGYIGFNSPSDPVPLAGDYLTTVLFTPDDSDNFSTVTGMVTVVVNPAGTTTALDSSGTPAAVGDAVTFTATVLSSAASGTVTFKDGGTTLGSGGLSDGQATFTTHGFAVANHPIRAEYGGDANYAASVSLVLTQAVNGTATVVLGNLSQSYNGTGKSVGVVTSPTNLAVGVTYNGSASLPVDVGSYSVIGTINDANYSGSATNTLVISKGVATVTLGSLGQTYNGAARSVSAVTEPVVLPVILTYDGSASAPTNAGSYAVIGTIDSANYAGASTNTLVVGGGPATVTLGKLSQTYNGSARPASVSTVPSGLSLSVTYNGSATAPVNVGSYTVAALVTSPNYTGGTTNTLVVGKASQTIDLQLAVTNSIPLNQFTNPIVVTATASSGLTVALTLDAGSAATLTATNTLVNVSHTGIITLRANQPGNANYTVAAEEVVVLDVTKVAQTIQFAAVADQVVTNAPFNLTATASSGLVVQYTVVSGPATVSGNQITLTGVGLVRVAADQSGNTTYNAAETVNRSFNVTLASQSITFSPLSARAYGSGSFALSATASSGLPVSYVSSDLGVATLSGSTVTLVGVGSATFTASQAGNGVYDAASNVSQALIVNPGAATVALDYLTQGYNGTSRSVTATPTPSGLAVSVTYDGWPTARTNAGSYTAVATVTDPNYRGTNTATIQITPQALLVTAPAIASRGYDGTATAGALTVGTLSSFVGGEKVTTTGAAANYSSTDAGTYPGVVITYTLHNGTGGGLAANYSLANGTASGQVTTKALSVTAPSIVSKGYDGAATAGQVMVGSLSGFVDSETVTATGAAANYSSANVGSYPGVVITYTLHDGPGGGGAGNYGLANGTAAGQITPKALSVTGIRASDKVYDGTTIATLILTNAALAGNLDGTQVVLSTANATGAFADPNVGTNKTVQVSGLTISGSATDNYAFSQPTTNAIIAGKPLNITANAESKTYGEVTIYGAGQTAFTTGAGELVSGDSVSSVTLACPDGWPASAAVGSYHIIASVAVGVGLGNYSITYHDGMLAVQRANSVTALVSSGNPSVHGSNVTFTATLSPGAAGGTVTFKDGADTLGTGTLSAGVATFVTNGLSLGVHLLTAEYGGDATYTASTSSILTQSVYVVTTAVNDTLGALENTNTIVAASVLTANDIWAAAYTGTITNVTYTGTHGGVVALTGTDVIYTPATNYVGSDVFTYTLSDGHGGVSVGTVAVTVQDSAGNPPSSIGGIIIDGGTVKLTFRGVPLRTYRVQTTESLLTPNWQTLGTATASRTGVITYQDTPPGGVETRFYCIRPL